MDSSVVYALVMITYNAVSGGMGAEPQSFHISPSDCAQEIHFQNSQGRKETYNRKYTCVRLNDAVRAAQVRAAHGYSGNGNARRASGGRIVIEFN